MDETSFSRGTAYGQTRARVEEMDAEYDARAGKVDKYLSMSLLYSFSFMNLTFIFNSSKFIFSVFILEFNANHFQL